MSEQLWWHVSRGSGIVAWALVATSVLWGLALAGRFTRKPAPAWTLDLHRFMGGLAVTFTVVHMIALVADSYVHFGLADLLVPFMSDWKPGAVALGVVAMYLLVAVQVTSIFMRRIPRPWWRAVHSTSFVLYVGATLHLITAGTDARTAWLQWLALVSAVAVVFLALFRVIAPSRGQRTASA